MVLTAKTMLPPSTDAAVWLAIKSCETYADFHTTLCGCIQYPIDHGVGNPAASHLVDLDQADRHARGSPTPSPLGSDCEAMPAAEDFPDGTFASAAALDNYVVVMSRFAQRRQRQMETGARKGQRPIRSATPPRDAKDAKCANCNQAGHTAQQCNARAQDSSQTSVAATRATRPATYRGRAQTKIGRPGRM